MELGLVMVTPVVLSVQRNEVVSISPPLLLFHVCTGYLVVTRF